MSWVAVGIGVGTAAGTMGASAIDGKGKGGPQAIGRSPELEALMEAAMTTMPDPRKEAERYYQTMSQTEQGIKGAQMPPIPIQFGDFKFPYVPARQQAARMQVPTALQGLGKERFAMGPGWIRDAAMSLESARMGTAMIPRRTPGFAEIVLPAMMQLAGQIPMMGTPSGQQFVQQPGSNLPLLQRTTPVKTYGQGTTGLGIPWYGQIPYTQIPYSPWFQG